ncbi:hypothetical protein COK13_00465 [Bacillus cereus]|nr:hypothetical protein COJ38_30355 [Bacillus cereus]RFB58427.1 hypothetical protein DZB82_28245 [Bacillus sp. dmp5]PFO50242.1 hypothetical protein COJ74_28030 [Bacillus cereus]PFQ02598.1 hypothetical protein COK12_21605 [Bacillus cereus]PFQ26823.1 hypothetical protein COK13_00465 [Bacillus cereus]
MDALLVRLIFYARTEWLDFRTLFSSCNLLYQVIKELHIASLSKVFGDAKPKFISHLSLGYALHTLEEGEFFRGIR